MTVDSSNGFYNVHQVLGKFIARILCSMTLTECEVWGEEHLSGLPRPYILVMNHCSHWDPVTVWAYFPDFVSFMVKEELHRVPSLGLMSRTAGNISVKREGADVGAVKEALKLVRKGYNLCVFAEGTRSMDGTVQEFKDGAVSLASRLRVPIVPAYINGTHTTLPRGGRLIKANRSQIHILEPQIDCVEKRLSKDEMDAMTLKLHQLILNKQNRVQLQEV